MSKPFPWRPGMRTTTGRRLTEHGEGSIPPLHAHPDPNDGATIGALLQVVREEYNDPHIYVAPADGWYVGGGGRDVVLGEGATEFDALLAARERRSRTDVDVLDI